MQFDVEPVPAVNAELHRLAFAIPDVEERSTAIGFGGSRALWLGDDVEIMRPESTVCLREFAHIHPDGSIHAILPPARVAAMEAAAWGVPHPLRYSRDGWSGFVMLYTPQSLEELETTFLLLLESYNYVTGRNLQLEELPAPQGDAS